MKLTDNAKLFPIFYHRLRNTWPIWYYLINREPRLIWQKHTKTTDLKHIQKEIIQSLNRDGIAIIDFSQLFGDPSLFQSMQKHTHELLNLWHTDTAMRAEIMAEKKSPSSKKGYDKDFLIPLWGGAWTTPILTADHLFTNFFLNERLLEIIAGYIGLAPKLNSFSLQSTIIVPPNSPESLSQRWHRDPEDKKMCKVFMYLSDVDDEGTGPFKYIKGSQLGGRWRNIFPQRPPAGRYPEIGAVEKIVPREDIKLCTGKAGTIIFADTSGLHKGGYSTVKARLMFIAGFVSKASYMPIKYKIPDDTDLNGLSKLARYAVKRTS